MPNISLRLADGTERRIAAAAGASLMRAAVDHGVPGILGECGGSLSCATCHVFVEPVWYDRLPAPGDNENTLLDFTAAPRTATSRLSCQVVLTDALDGAVFHIPERQT